MHLIWASKMNYFRGKDSVALTTHRTVWLLLWSFIFCDWVYYLLNSPPCTSGLCGRVPDLRLQDCELLGSVNEYQHKPKNKRAYRAMHEPHICGPAASACVWLRTNETEITAALWTREAREGLKLFCKTCLQQVHRCPSDTVMYYIEPGKCIIMLLMQRMGKNWLNFC